MHFSCLAMVFLLFFPAVHAQDSLRITRVTRSFSRVDCWFRITGPEGTYLPADPANIRLGDDGMTPALLDFSCAPLHGTEPLSIVFALDISGSMTGERLAAEILAVRSVLAQMDGVDDEAGIVVFNGSPTLLQPLTKNRDSLSSALDRISAGGATVLWDGIMTALMTLQTKASNAGQVVIAVTDGANSSGTYSLADIITASQRDRIRICPISIGIPYDLYLTMVASGSGGIYHHLATIGDCPAAALTVLQRARAGFEECRATWAVPCMDGTVRPVRLEVGSGAGLLTATGQYRTPRDTSTFSALPVLLLTVPAMTTECSVPLILDAAPASGRLEPFRAAFVYDNTLLTFLGADVSGSEFEGRNLTVTTGLDSVIMESQDRIPIRGRELCRFVFRFKVPTPGTFASLRWVYWLPKAGCEQPELTDGGVFLEPVEVSIANEGPAHPCPGQTVRLVASSGLSDYAWNSGDTTRSIEVTDVGPWMFQARTPGGISVRSSYFLVPYVRMAKPRIAFEGMPFLCDSTPVKLSLAQAFASYRWSNGDTTASIHTAYPDSFFVTVTDSNGCTAVSDTVVIQAGAFPDALVEGNRTACAGDPISYRAPVFPSVRYQWSATGGELLSDPGADAVTVRWQPGEQTLRLEIRRADSGCSVSTLITVHVMDAPKPHLILHGDSVACLGDSVRLEASDGYGSYLWSTGATSRICSVPYPGGRIYVRAITQGGCVVYSDSILVRIYPLPSAYFAMPSVVCTGRIYSYRLSDSTNSVLWELEGGEFVGRDDQPDVEVRWGAGTVGRLTANVSDGLCTARYGDSVQIHHNLPCKIRYMTDSVVCEHGYLSLDAGEGYKEYLWSDGVTTRYRLVRLQGWYAVTVSDQFGCGSSTDSVFVTVLPAPPVPVITRIGDTLVSDSAVTYQWYRDGAPVPAPKGRQRILPLPGPGDYYVIITDSVGCWEMSKHLSILTLSIEGVGQPEEPHLVISPNPTYGVFNVHLGAAARTAGTLNLYDLLGRCLYAEKFDPGTQILHVSLPGLAPAVYVVNVRISGGSVYARIAFTGNR